MSKAPEFDDKPPERVQMSKAAEALGYAGLLPQIAAVLAVIYAGGHSDLAVASGYIYASLIFSFLGGVWWGQAMGANEASARIYMIAVMPSLLAFATLLLSVFVWERPTTGLLILGPMIALSPLVDRSLGFASKDFMRLRWHLSLGLGALTSILGLIGSA